MCERNTPCVSIVSAATRVRSVLLLLLLEDTIHTYVFVWLLCISLCLPIANTRMGTSRCPTHVVYLASGLIDYLVPHVKTIISIWTSSDVLVFFSTFYRLDLGCRFTRLRFSFLFPQGSRSLLKIGSWTLSNLCDGQPRPVLDVHTVIPALSKLLQHTDSEILRCCGGCVFYCLPR